MTTKCAGLNCRFPEENHSPECIAEHAASAAGGRFVPSALAASGQKLTDEHHARLERFAQTLEAGSAFDGISDGNATAYAESIRALLRASSDSGQKLTAEITMICNRYLVKQGSDFDLGGDKCAREVLRALLHASGATASDKEGA